MAGTKDMAERRKMRALEAKRDTLMEKSKREKIQLAEVRAALKAMKQRRRRKTA